MSGGSSCEGSGLGVPLARPDIRDSDGAVTDEQVEHLLNVMQRWIAETHRPDNEVWQEAKRAVPLVRKFLAEHGHIPLPMPGPRGRARPNGRPLFGVQEITTMEQARARIQQLELVVGSYYGEEGVEEEVDPVEGSSVQL